VREVASTPEILVMTVPAGQTEATDLRVLDTTPGTAVMAATAATAATVAKAVMAVVVATAAVVPAVR
jgi:hypothetical protein